MTNIYLINDKYKYIILCYPKSGCSVLRLLHLYLNDNVKDRKKDTLFEDKHHNLPPKNFVYKQEYDSYYKVIVYRNPYERLCSLFYQKVCGVISTNITNNNKLMDQPKRLNGEINTFNKWLDALISNKYDNDIHFQPQKKNFFKYDEIIEINNITNIFYKNEKLNTLVNETLLKYNLNNKNSLEKYDFENFKDLSNYDFYKDNDKLLTTLGKVPNYKYLLNEENIRKIHDNYKDDFFKEINYLI